MTPSKTASVDLLVLIFASVFAAVMFVTFVVLDTDVVAEAFIMLLVLLMMMNAPSRE